MVRDKSWNDSILRQFLFHTVFFSETYSRERENKFCRKVLYDGFPKLTEFDLTNMLRSCTKNLSDKGLTYQVRIGVESFPPSPKPCLQQFIIFTNNAHGIPIEVALEPSDHSGFVESSSWYYGLCQHWWCLWIITTFLLCRKIFWMMHYEITLFRYSGGST